MANKSVIQTENAPQAIGPYSQAVKAGDTVYISGQIPLVPETMELATGDFSEKTRQVFDNLQAVCEAAGGELKDIVKVNIYVTDLANFSEVNDIMATYFPEPYPARAAVEVSALPKGVPLEVEAIMVLS
ncbi:RidA family protein [Marinobacter piscensis]|uniref:RidA family protein n=1 Tax=Marinobacter piscensis TaxID=1562308 RepID=UPI0011A73C5A|nr:RidA family protein [Marinobacter piscensis]